MSELEKRPIAMPPTIFEAKAIENSVNGKGYFVLPKGTRAMLSLPVPNQEGTDYDIKSFGLITLKSPMEVRFPMGDVVSEKPLDGAPKSTMTVNFVPSSEKLRAGIDKFQELNEAFYNKHSEFKPWDVPDASDISDKATAKELEDLNDREQKLDDAERDLALGFLKGREELLERQGLKKSQVETIILSISIPALEFEEIEEKDPWIAVPIDVYSARLSEEIAQGKTDKEGK